MANNIIGGSDGVTFPAGWDNQANLPGSLESYTNSSGLLYNSPAQNAYGAWTLIPEDALTTNAHVSTSGYLMRVFVPANFSCGHLDMVATAASAVTNAVFAIYSGAGFATGPLVWTANQSGLLTGAGLVATTWNGASSPASINLAGGQTYWIYYELTFTTSATLAGSTGASAISMNPNLTASATAGTNAMVLSAAAPTSITASTTLAPQTSWANNNIKTWFGLRA